MRAGSGRIVCPLCRGEGRHSLGVDEGRLAPADMDEWTPEAVELYASGDMDALCEACEGEGAVEASEAYVDALEALLRYTRGLRTGWRLAWEGL